MPCHKEPFQTLQLVRDLRCQVWVVTRTEALGELIHQCVDPAAFAAYLHGRDTTRREHLLELQRDFGFRAFSATIYRELAGWLLPIALSTDVGPVLWSTSYANARSWLRRCRQSSGWLGRRVVEPSGSCSSG